MGLIIKLNNQTFNNTIGYVDYPSHNNLANLFFLGGTTEEERAKSLIDKSGNKYNGILNEKADNGIQHTVTWYDNYIHFPNGDETIINEDETTTTKTNRYYPRIDLPNSLTSDTFTIIAVCRGYEKKRSIVANNNPQGFAVHSVGIYANAKPDGTTIISNITSSNTNGDKFQILVWKITDGTSFKIMKDGINGLADMTTNKPKDGCKLGIYTQPLIIGGQVSTGGNISNTGDLDIAMVGIYDGVVEDAYIQDAIDYLRTYYTKKGLELE